MAGGTLSQLPLYFSLKRKYLFPIFATSHLAPIFFLHQKVVQIFAKPPHFSVLSMFFRGFPTNKDFREMVSTLLTLLYFKTFPLEMIFYVPLLLIKSHLVLIL
jgi:hypothetical protein